MVEYLTFPTIDLFPAFQRMIRDFEQYGEVRFDKERSWEIEDFKQYLNRLRDHREGINLPLDRMPQALYWLLNEKGEITAIGSIRLRMNAFLLQEGGQIGYTVVPRFRNQGIGTRLLGELIKKAKVFDLSRLLVTCNEGNTGSRKIIEKNGGIYENKVFSEDKNTVVLRYWIDTT